MKRVSKLVGIVPRELQERYVGASEAERASLRPVIEREQGWMIERMAAKGYRLEGTVLDVFGLFTRGPARGTLRRVAESSEPATA
jgi:hypothetical protein